VVHDGGLGIGSALAYSAIAPSDFIANVHGRGYYLKAPDKVAEVEMPSEVESASPKLLKLAQSKCDRRSRRVRC
jgi:hypothetical protein